jgi:putative molybdopterin biosynthesis protein
LHRLLFNYELVSQDDARRLAAPIANGLSGGAAPIRNPLIELLGAVAQTGSISAAARRVGLSYRHVWGELKRWEQVLGHDIVVWEKGKAARLTEFASKLLWAEAQAQARLAPQIEALRSELERTFAVAFDDAAHVVTLYASHDDALLALREHALHLDRGALHLDIRFTGSVDAIRALNEGRCVMAGFHTLPQPAPDSLAERTYRPLLQPGRHKVIGFASRTQGLMVAPGNPLGISSLLDVARLKARFANRALGTGTRLLLDELLAQSGLRPEHIEGFDRTETSHAAVAQAVASGQAQAGLGIEAAACARGLDFVALAQERYHLVCLKEALDQAPVRALRQMLQSAAWQDAVNRIAGYQGTQSGEVLALSQVLPWWQFKSKKKR